MDGFFKHSRKLLQQTARDKRLTAADRQILDVAMLNTRNPGDEVTLSLAFLETQTGLKRRTIIMSRKRLVSLDYLAATGKGASGTPSFIIQGGAQACTGGARECTQLETGNIETTTYAQNNEKPPSCSAPPEIQISAPKVTPKKPKVTMADMGFVIPDAIRQTWATAHPGLNIDREAAKAFAWCQNNPRKAPKKDYDRFLNGWLGRARPAGNPAAPQDDDSIGYLLYKLEHVEAKYGEDMARRYDAKARELNSTIQADQWLKKEVACRTA